MCKNSQNKKMRGEGGIRKAESNNCTKHWENNFNTISLFLLCGVLNTGIEYSQSLWSLHIQNLTRPSLKNLMQVPWAGELVITEDCIQLYSQRGDNPYLATTNAHATVIELEFLQSVACRALEQSLKATHTVWPKGIVTQVQLHQLGSSSNKCIPQRDL